MRIVGVQASGRPKGNTEILLAETLRPFRDSGDEVHVLKLARLDLRHCTGCFGCNNKDFACVIKDDLYQVKTEIEAADVLVVAAPCFAVGAPSTLKTVMDRSAAWALDHIASGAHRRYGAAVMVAGADTPWITQQRLLPAQFLRLYNAEVVGMFTVQKTGLKGEVLLRPDALRRAYELGATLRKAAEQDARFAFPFTDQPDRLHCPICLSDAFHVARRGRFTCAVCGHEVRGSLRRDPGRKAWLDGRDTGIFTALAANHHNTYVGGKISGAMDASGEIKRRADAYFETDIVPTEEFTPEQRTSSLPVPRWTEDGTVAFEEAVPKVFKTFVRKAVERKAAEKGLPEIDREAFLAIKRESGN